MTDKKKGKIPKHNPTDNLRPQTAPPFSKDNQPSPEAKSKGQKRYQALKSLKNDLFEDMVGHDIPKDMIEKIKIKVAQGDIREALDLLKIVAPKEMDITSDGEKIDCIVTGIARPGDEKNT